MHLGVRSDKNRRILKVFARKISQFGHIGTLLLIEPRKKKVVRDARSQLVHEIGRSNFARLFLPNSARNGISICSRNDLKISDFYLNPLLGVFPRVSTVLCLSF
jgi:hypothetical protein